MRNKPSYEELEARIRELERDVDAEPEIHDRDIIRTLSESFQQLADLSQDAIYLFDIESGTFPFFNKRFLALYGVKEEGRTILSSYSAARHIHPEDVEKLRAARESTLESGGMLGEVEYRYISSDGTTRWMHDRWSVLQDSRSRVVAIEGFIRDNTHKKQAAKEQRDKEKLQAVLEMAGAVSHELNNPLQVVLTGIERMADTSLSQSLREELIQLAKEHTLKMIELSSKIQNISQYAAKDYVQGKKIFDIDAASDSSKAGTGQVQARAFQDGGQCCGHCGSVR